MQDLTLKALAQLNLTSFLKLGVGGDLKQEMKCEVEVKTWDRMKAVTRWLERLSVQSLVKIAILIILCSSLFYFFLPYPDDGIIVSSNSPPHILDAIYFSVVTFSSLGYGDIQPSGYSRAVAVIEVLCGLVLLALIVARLSSDRISAHARILYQGETLRVMREFEDKLRDRIAELREASDQGDVRQIDAIARSINVHLVGLRSYYSLQQQMGDIGEDWARKASLRLANSVVEVSANYLDLAVSPVASHVALSRIEKALEISMTIVVDIGGALGPANLTRARTRLADIQKGFIRLRHPTQKQSLVITEKLKETVSSKLPSGEWPKAIHKKIAKQLGLSNQVVQKVIYALLDDKLRSASRKEKNV